MPSARTHRVLSLLLLLLLPRPLPASWSIYDVHESLSNWTLHLLPASSGARCLDGSPAGYYWRAGRADALLVHVQGGGWPTSLDEALARSRTRLGSSRGWPRAMSGAAAGPVRTDGGEAGMMSADPRANPALHDWSAAYLCYCDGSSFTSDVAAPVRAGGRGEELHFRGRAIMDAFAAAVAARAPRAREVVLKGCSAGGLAVVHAVDRFAAAWDARTTRVVGAPEAALFLDTPGVDGEYHYRRHFQARARRGGCRWGEAPPGERPAYAPTRALRSSFLTRHLSHHHHQ